MTANIYSSKSDVAYAELRRLILLGPAAGSRLPQYEFAATLNMSITPIREAIRRLSSEGLIDLDTHKDARVASISAEEARQLFEVRLLLDRRRSRWRPRTAPTTTSPPSRLPPDGFVP